VVWAEAESISEGENGFLGSGGVLDKRRAGAGKDWIFVSDAHFTATDKEEIEVFVRFLDSEMHRMGDLVILGDLFEFLFGFRRFAFPEYTPILKVLNQLSRQGIRIKYFEGNHDFFLNRLLAEELGTGVDVYPDGGEERLGGKRAFLSHGDLSGDEAWRYRVFRRGLKNPLSYSLIRAAGPTVMRPIASWLSRRSFRRNHPETRMPPDSPRAFAHRKFLEGFDVVILGHSHFSETATEEIGPRRCFYFNLGAWMSGRSYLRFTPPDTFLPGRYEQ
jgi:UDP-2,3-diacylglucosamine hydrolase